MLPLIAVFICYLLGTFPTGLLVGRFYGVDVTSKGSGNIGATNIARTVGKIPGIITLILDVLKGYVACLLFNELAQGPSDSPVLALSIGGVSAVLGHCLSIPGMLRGGKGVATGLGVLLAVSPYTAFASLIVFFLTFAATRIVSISSILACAAAFFSYSIYFASEAQSAILVLILTLLIVYKHKENITRLMAGSEPKFAIKKAEN